MLTSKQRRTCFHLWPMLPKYWTHGKSLKKNNAHLCSMSYFLLKLLFGLLQSLSKWLWWQPQRLEGFPLQNWTTQREAALVFFLVSCTACTHVSTCIYSIPICIKNCWSRVPWVLLLTFTHIDWRLLYLWCSSIYRTK